jgi:outer membrane protein TolC
MLLDSYIQDVNSNIELATYLPTLQLVAQLYGNQTGYWTESYSDFVKNPSAVLTFQWTGFDGGSARMRSSSYQKLAESAYQAYLDTVNQVKKEARSGFYQVEKGKDIVLSSAAQVQQASKSLELQTARFQLGYGSVTDLVQAQQQMAQAVLDYVANLRQYNQDLLTLARNTGLEIDRGALFLDAVGEPLASLRRITRL